LLLGIGLYGFYIAPFQLSVGRIQMAVPGLSRPMRIVQLSDLHVERTTRREQALPGLVASLHPDLIVLTGDYLNLSYLHDDRAAGDLHQLLGQLHAPLGIYAVNGTVEHPQEMENLFAGLDIHPLEDAAVRIPAFGDHFVILGLNNAELNYDQTQLERLVQQVRPGDFSLLLYHTPDLAYAARDLHINLYLAGHTHGGQIRLPFYGAVFTNSHWGKTFEMGLYRLDQTTLYVSRGIGLEGKAAPRARLLCPPEVVVVDLEPG
jgi:predicted MPP superfamily phosphohydrolase